MSDYYPPLSVKVWGELACFTRPEMKVERVSYSVMTPSAARGVLQAIFWKPEFDYRVLMIHVLKPIRYFSILRNEIQSRQSDRVARVWQRTGECYEAPSDRSQRHTLALRDVSYIITAQMQLRPHADANPAKYRDQFRRRVREGRCFTMPFLGCREFSCAFAEPDGSEQPIPVSDELGPMLLDLDYAPDRSGRGRPRFFQAHLAEGVLHVPAMR